ncbi:unnamed protein product [Effrenium voratum]|uniref:Lipase maturation factor n=1 Tax=Effrenium voratum TaxID=2562239 RepID=A0AA36MK93_9DINO|nr:unnamed protein product [Effrenium voratum]
MSQLDALHLLWRSSLAWEDVWVSYVSFWKSEVPGLLKLLAASLAKARLPLSWRQAAAFSMSEWLDAAPIMAGILAASVTPLALLRGGRRSASDLQNSWWLTRDLLVRGMGLCFFCGFLVSALQHRALWGSLGLQPVQRTGRRPTPVFDLFDSLGWGYGDWQLELVSWLGVSFSVQLMVGRVQSLFVPAFLWAAYLSIVNLQAPFTFSYGWEWLTCEVGFLVIFLCPLLGGRFSSWTPPSRMVLWLVRWCAFRLLLGAGMSKVGRNSSACWRQLTCTETHYFTQPIPNPLSWYMHHLPENFHQIEVALTFLEQLVLPFAMLVPLRSCRLLAAVLEIGFQATIVGTGNYAWINFIGALPCVAMLDDAFLLALLPGPLRKRAEKSVEAAKVQPTGSKAPVRWAARGYGALRGLVNLVLVLVMVYKSKDPIKELFGPAPWINSYDQWFLMNSQGVFGFINQHRVQVVLKYTHDASPGSPSAVWKPLDFKCLPGSPERRPCFMSPYHYRLDWETWIRVTASLESLWAQKAPPESYHQHLPDFLQALVVKILNGDDDAAGLMGVPLPELYRQGEPPTAVSIDFASYTFTSAKNSTRWWRARPVGKASLRAYGRESVVMPSGEVRKSPRGRHWLLALSAVGSLRLLELGSCAHLCARAELRLCASLRRLAAPAGAEGARLRRAGDGGAVPAVLLWPGAASGAGRGWGERHPAAAILAPLLGGGVCRGGPAGSCLDLPPH